MVVLVHGSSFAGLDRLAETPALPGAGSWHSRMDLLTWSLEALGHFKGKPGDGSFQRGLLFPGAHLGLQQIVEREGAAAAAGGTRVQVP